jgi:hypothetical protein
LLLLLCLATRVKAAGEIEWCIYVDPDAGGNNDGGRDGADPNDPSQANNWTDAYTSLSASEAYQDAGWGGQDLTSEGVWLHVYTKSSSGGDDTTTFRYDAFTTDADSYILVEGYDFPTDGIWDATKYLFHNNDSANYGIECRENYIRWDNIQFLVTESGGNNRDGLVFNVIAAGANDIRVHDCIFKGVCSGTGEGRGLFPADTDIVAKIWNCVVYDFFISADTGFRGIDLLVSSATVYNCTIYNCSRGINRAGGTVTVKNCAVGICDDDFAGTITMDYIVSDDNHSGDCANYWSAPTAGAGDWSSDYTTPGSVFTLLATATDLIGNGLDDPGSGDYSDDITGTARSSTWDVGAFEYVAAGGISIPIAMYHYMNH